MQEEQSNLTRQEYWETFYSKELEVFEECGNQGEEWFESETDALTTWIRRLPGIQPDKTKVLDIGCGNGLFLLRLARKFGTDRCSLTSI